MSHGFINETSIRAKDIETLNRRVISVGLSNGEITGDNIDGGNVFQLTKTSIDDLPTGVSGVGIDGKNNSEIYRVSKPLTENSGDTDESTIVSNARGLAMAYNPEVMSVIVNGKEYAGLSKDVRDFTNLAKKPFDAFVLKKYDLIELSEDCIDGTYVASGENATGYLVPQNNDYKLTFSKVAGITVEEDNPDYDDSDETSSPTIDVVVPCTCLAIRDVKTALFPKAGVGNEYVTTYLCEVIYE